MITQIRKRTGQVCPFEKEKVTRAVEKAFLGVTGELHVQDAEEITTSVVVDLEARQAITSDHYTPSVEEVQDIVERALMERKFFSVGKAYIVYRYEHQKIREKKQEVVREKIERKEFFVTNEKGEREALSNERISELYMRAARGVEESVDIAALARQTEKEVYEGMTTRDVGHTLTLVARSFVERDPAYSLVASRILLETSVYPDAIGKGATTQEDFVTRYQDAFVANIRRGVALGLIDTRMLDFDFVTLSRKLEPERDDLLRYLGTQTLADRYFLRDKRDRNRHVFLEAPQMMWMRIAMGLSLLEKEKDHYAASFYDLISTLRYTPATPTLLNSGTTNNQLSSCFLGVVDDNLESIFKSYQDYAHMAKRDGGVGQSWTKLRATGARVKTTHIESGGTTPFLKILDSTVVCINRAGRRRGACAVYLEPWHADVEDFIELRKNTGDERRRTHNLNTALWIPDVFMKRVRDDEKWSLMSPDETPDLVELYGSAFERQYEAYEAKGERGELHLFKQMRARDLWKKILTQLFETGHPWITFKDASNIRSPQDHVGVIHNSNLCTEITLNTSADDEVAVCNLGSVNLAKHISNKRLDNEKIKETVTLAMRMLDNVIDINMYPIPEAEKSNVRHRPVGLGLMGFQDALFLQEINFDSPECVAFADSSMEIISYYAILASSELARERGVYETYQGSKWQRGIFPIDTLDTLAADRGEEIDVDRSTTMDWSVVRESVKQHGMRNSNCMAMAPTATIANIAGCFPTIEPIYKNMYVKSNISGEFTVTNSYLVEDLKKEGLWNSEMLEILKGLDGNLDLVSSIPAWIKDRHKEVFAIDSSFLIRAAAYRGKYIDQSQSLNVFFSGTSGAKLSDVYMLAWQLGVKTTYYLRTLSASAVEKSTVELSKQNLESTIVTRRTAAEDAVAEVKQELQEHEIAPVVTTSAPATASVVEPAAESTPTATLEKPTLKLCKIDDPDCEACQ
jgi:ribonucleoside-diphosphate reductase alpha chain